MPIHDTPFATRVALSTAGLLAIFISFVTIDHLGKTSFFEVASTLGGLLVAAAVVRSVKNSR